MNAIIISHQRNDEIIIIETTDVSHHNFDEGRPENRYFSPMAAGLREQGS